MSGEEGHIYRGALPVDYFQIFSRIVHISTAVAAHGGGNALPQHHGEYALPDAALFHGILVHMDVNKAGSDDFSGGVDLFLRLRKTGADPEDSAIFQQQIVLSVKTIGRINDPAAIYQCFHRSS